MMIMIIIIIMCILAQMLRDFADLTVETTPTLGEIVCCLLHVFFFPQLTLYYFKYKQSVFPLQKSIFPNVGSLHLSS